MSQTLSDAPYRLDEHVGFLLRRANQRHLSIFAAHIPDLTPQQFAALAKISELGETSQNLLGRETAMDAATIKGVVDRLMDRGLLAARADPEDRRLRLLKLTATGGALFEVLSPRATAITRETLSPLSELEQRELNRLLERIAEDKP